MIQQHIWQITSSRLLYDTEKWITEWLGDFMPNFLIFVGVNLLPNVNIMGSGLLMFEEMSSPTAIILSFSWFGAISSSRGSVQINSIKQKDTSFWQDRWEFYAPALFNNDLWLYSYIQTQQLAINVNTCSMENIINESLPFHTQSSLEETLQYLSVAWRTQLLSQLPAPRK